MTQTSNDKRPIQEIISHDIYPVIKQLLPENQNVVPNSIGAEIMHKMSALLPWESMISPSLLRHYYEFGNHFGLTPAQKAVVAKGLLLWLDNQDNMVKLIHDSIDYQTKLTHIQKSRMFTCVETAFMGAYLLRQKGIDAYVMACGTYDKNQHLYLKHHSMTLYTTQKGMGLSDMIADLTQEHVRIFDYWMGVDDTACNVLSKADELFLLDRKKVKTCCTVPDHPLDANGDLMEPKPRDYIAWQKRFYLSQYNIRGFEIHKDSNDTYYKYLPAVSPKAYRAKAIQKPSKLMNFLARCRQCAKIR